MKESQPASQMNEPSPPQQPGGAIAIVGVAFRFPGDVDGQEQLWAALREGRDLIGEIPADRWATGELAHPSRGEPGRSITYSAGVLSRIDEFDAGFFGISPREAAWLDPQQRLLLELAWESMENAGVRPSSLAATDCAVFVGISGLDYGIRGLDDLASMASHSMTGNTLSIAANRLSYVFDLRGPSLAIDTACSSSLVALHHACNCLRAGEASAALVGGVNVLLHPYPFVGFTKASMLSADGRCKVFDASGNGYVRSEGAAVLLLKPLERAIADGDTIEAVILASGVNADGARKTGITIPSAAGQEELMRGVLARAGLASGDIDFVEAHGTGTAIGDPIEAAAIGSVYGKGRQGPLPVGSVKANLGHLEPASGMAGLVKAILVLKNRALPPALHLKNPNPHIDFVDLNLELVTEYRSLAPAAQRPLIGAVNSFGFGGANSHVVLQEYRPAVAQAPNAPDLPLPPLVLSARSEAALRATAGRYAALLAECSAADFYDIAYAAAFRRERLDKRLSVDAATVESLAGLLAQYARGENPPAVVVENGLPHAGRLAFVYAGNGSQWCGMGRLLLAQSSRFREIIGELDRDMAPLAGFSIIAELEADGDRNRIADTVVAQPLLFALQVAVTVLLREQGLVPAAVTGHSVGEVAAAWAAGALDLDAAIRVICARSRAQGLTRGSGRMAAVGVSRETFADLLAAAGGVFYVEVAGINSPDSLTIAGSLSDLRRIEALLSPKGVFFRLLDLDYAFHSRQMDPVRAPLLESLAGLAPARGGPATFVSTVTGSVLDGTALGADYWWLNVREPVRFADAINAMAELGCRVFVEIGPHAILQRYIADCLKSRFVEGRVLSTLRRQDDGPARLTETVLRTLLLAGDDELAARFPVAGRAVLLPNYAWQRERHWHPRSSESLNSLERRRVHPLLGWPLDDSETLWENIVDAAIVPWLSDHRVGDAIVFPGAGYLEMALAAAREWLGGEHLSVEELDVVAPMVFDGEHARTLRFVLNARDGSFQIKSRQRLGADGFTLHAAGRIVEAGERFAPPRIGAFPAESQVKSQAVDREDHYRRAATLGLDYGPAFRGFAGGRLAGERLDAHIELPVSVPTAAYLLHPAIVDVCYQSLVDFFADAVDAGQGVALLPVKIGTAHWRGGEAVRFRARLRRRGARSVVADFEFLDGEGRQVATLAGCRFRAAPLRRHDQAKVSAWRVVPWLKPHPADAARIALPRSKELLELLRAGHAAVESQRSVWFKEILPLLEALTLTFASEAVEALAQRAPADWHAALRSPYAQWITALLRREGVLVEAAGAWQLNSMSDMPAAAEIWRDLLREAPACLPQLTLIGRVGRHLPELLCGEIDAAGFLAGMRASPATESLLSDDPVYAGTRLAIDDLLQGLAARCPDNRRLRVLEVVAGGDELPQRLLDSLPEDRLDYVLANLGAGGAGGARRAAIEHADYPNAVAATLSSDDWSLQSDRPLPEAFDVVILRHVLHRAESPHALLVRARRWLAQGGRLLVAERYPDWSADFLEGLDPAWWHPAEGGTDTIVSSLMAPDNWQQMLREEGFADCEAFTEPAAEGLPEGAYLLLATRPDGDAETATAPAPAVWTLLVDGESAALAEHLRSRLESQGQAVGVLRDADAAARLVGGDGGGDAASHLVCMLGWQAAPESAPAQLGALCRRVQALAAQDVKAPRLWIVCRGGALAEGLAGQCDPNPAQAAVWGFGRVVMNEYPALRCTLIDLAVDPAAPDLAARLENELLRPDGTGEIALTGSARFALALREERAAAASPVAADDRFRLDFQIPGQLRNLRWMPLAERPLVAGEIEVRAHATGLNFRDVMYLMGLLPDEAVESGFAGASLGLEFSGVVTRVGAGVKDLLPGDAVMGFGASCFASHIVTRADAVTTIPETWSFASAATVPTVFFTVYYALRTLADLQPGERVLIHGGAGGVGIAAIQLARHLGAEVFATAGSDEKRDFVRLLGADHVFDSRDLGFSEDILLATDGEGVDVVLNSLAGEAIRRNLRVLKPFGRFLELGKRDFFENTPIGLRPFKDNISYFGIDADQLLIARPQLATRLFREVMALFREGVLSPLPYRIFAADRVVDAFRVMQQARHIGKIVVSLADARPAVDRPQPLPAPAAFARDSTWLVSGGLVGFGLESARWLAARGVGNLVLLGRRGSATPGAQALIEEFAKQGVRALALACDVADADAVRQVVAEVRKTMPPLRGILHAAATFDDRLIGQLDEESITGVLQPKLLGAWNLHQATLDVPLDHFVLYSSITTAIGNPGQANYVAANMGLEGLAELRRRFGLPATCIGWGPIGDAGYLTRNLAVRDSLAGRLGKPPLSAAEAMAQLDRALTDVGGVMAFANFDWSVLARLLPSAPGTRFALLNRTLQDHGDADDTRDIRAMIAGKSAEQVADLVRGLVVQQVAQILCIGTDRIEAQRSLHELGMDSLMAVELALGLEQRFGIQLPVMMLNDSPTADKVTHWIVGKLTGAETQAASDASSDTVEVLARQHGEDLSRAEIEQTVRDARGLAEKGTRLSA